MNRFESLQDSYMLHDDICNADWEMVRLFLDKAIENIGEIEEKNQKFTLFSSSNVLGKLKKKKKPAKTNNNHSTLQINIYNQKGKFNKTELVFIVSKVYRLCK